MIVVVTGSRGWHDRDLIRLTVDALPPRSTVICGGAVGADTLFAGYARVRGHRVEEMRPDWSRGSHAGLERNVAMLDRMEADLDPEKRVLAFWLGTSRGTRHTIVEAMKRGLPMDLYWRPN